MDSIIEVETDIILKQHL